MVELKRKADFPFNITQKTEVWCIPATIQAVTKYCNSTDVPQEWIWERWVAACCEKKTNPLDIWFGSIKAMVLDKEEKFTSWTRAEAETSILDLDAVCNKVKDSLGEDVPPVISTPVFYNRILTGWHMLCIVAYEEDAFEVHDPNPFVATNPRNYSIAQFREDLTLAKSKATHLLLLHRRTGSSSQGSPKSD
jgi:hypothetical protein